MKSPKDIKNQSEKVKKEIFPIILNKIRNVDPEEFDSAKKELDNFIEYWLARSNTKELKYFWHPQKYNQSLLMSFESYAAKKASGSYTPVARPAPNSLRDVEPGVDYICKEKATDIYAETK